MEDLEGDKAPRLDGFNFNFIKSCWEIVDPDFLRVFKEFHRGGIIDKSLKNACVTLIPKREGPVELSHYWPISRLRSVYKLLAKVLDLIG